LGTELFGYNVRHTYNMELRRHQGPAFQIGDMVSYFDEYGAVSFGEINGIDEGTPLHPFVIEFDDGSVKHATLDGKINKKQITLINRKK